MAKYIDTYAMFEIDFVLGFDEHDFVSLPLSTRAVYLSLYCYLWKNSRDAILRHNFCKRVVRVLNIDKRVLGKSLEILCDSPHVEKTEVGYKFNGLKEKRDIVAARIAKKGGNKSGKGGADSGEIREQSNLIELNQTELNLTKEDSSDFHTESMKILKAYEKITALPPLRFYAPNDWGNLNKHLLTLIGRIGLDQMIEIMRKIWLEKPATNKPGSLKYFVKVWDGMIEDSRKVGKPKETREERIERISKRMG